MKRIFAACAARRGRPARRGAAMLLSAALLLAGGAGGMNRAYAQAVPQPKPQTQLKAGAAKPVKKPAAGQGSDDAISAVIQQDSDAGDDFAAAAKRRHLGDIEEQTPLMAPPKAQLFGEPIVPLGKKESREIVAPAANAPTIGNYPLNEALLARLEKIHNEILALPASGSGDSDVDDDSDNVDALVRALEKRPDIMGILGRNLISARDYIIAMQAVVNALAAASGAGGEQTSAANLTFGKKYAGRIRALLEE